MDQTRSRTRAMNLLPRTHLLDYPAWQIYTRIYNCMTCLSKARRPSRIRPSDLRDETILLRLLPLLLPSPSFFFLLSPASFFFFFCQVGLSSRWVCGTGFNARVQGQAWSIVVRGRNTLQNNRYRVEGGINVNAIFLFFFFPLLSPSSFFLLLPSFFFFVVVVVFVFFIYLFFFCDQPLKPRGQTDSFVWFLRGPDFTLSMPDFGRIIVQISHLLFVCIKAWASLRSYLFQLDNGYVKGNYGHKPRSMYKTGSRTRAMNPVPHTKPTGLRFTAAGAWVEN